MSGCTNCASKSGCEDHKEGMLATVADWLFRLYPSKTWGVLDDELAVESGCTEEDALAFAEELSRELKGATMFRQGSEEDLCDYIYVLCQGREPCALQMRYGEVPIPSELSPDDILNELYLRIALSSVSPLVVVQQVAVTMSQLDGEWMIREQISAGVYDAPLLRRFQRLVALLPAYDLVHVDMGEISTPPTGFDHGNYETEYGAAPHQSNYLFFRDPSTMQVTGALRSE